MQLLESGEMYLETIHILSLTNSRVRSVDVSEYRGFSKPSVSRAINLLKDNGYLTVSADGSLNLTEQGLSVAKDIYERHQLLTVMLCALGVDEMTAAEDACKIEHDISPSSFEAIKQRAIQLGLWNAV